MELDIRSLEVLAREDGGHLPLARGFPRPYARKGKARARFKYLGVE